LGDLNDRREERVRQSYVRRMVIRPHGATAKGGSEPQRAQTFIHAKTPIR
jgi:hypothetical protein